MVWPVENQHQMKIWKIALIVVALGFFVWFLNPQRAIVPNEPGVVEIAYTGDVRVSVKLRRGRITRATSFARMVSF